MSSAKVAALEKEARSLRASNRQLRAENATLQSSNADLVRELSLARSAAAAAHPALPTQSSPRAQCYADLPVAVWAHVMRLCDDHCDVGVLACVCKAAATASRSRGAWIEVDLSGPQASMDRRKPPVVDLSGNRPPDFCKRARQFAAYLASHAAARGITRLVLPGRMFPQPPAELVHSITQLLRVCSSLKRCNNLHHYPPARQATFLHTVRLASAPLEYAHVNACTAALTEALVGIRTLKKLDLTYDTKTVMAYHLLPLWKPTFDLRALEDLIARSSVTDLELNVYYAESRPIVGRPIVVASPTLVSFTLGGKGLIVSRMVCPALEVMQLEGYVLFFGWNSEDGMMPFFTRRTGLHNGSEELVPSSEVLAGCPRLVRMCGVGFNDRWQTAKRVTP